MIYQFRINHDNYGTTILDTKKCVHCGYCIFACREGVYKLNKELGVVEVVNPDNCSSCNECACPFEARMFLPYNEEVAKSAYALIGTHEYVV